MDVKDVVIIDGARTPFGAFGGSLKDISATDLAVVAARAAMERSKVDPAWIDHVVFGNVAQTSPDAAYLARHVGLKAGVPIQTPAVTVNRLCGSGLEAIVTGYRMILLGEAEFVLAGGTENMSMAPHATYGARWGLRLGDDKLVDVLWAALTDSYNQMPMAITAENLAEMYDISREEQDAFAYQSQMRAKEAWESGRLAEEVVPTEYRDRKGRTRVLERDEHPRPETTPESLAKLPPRFKQDGTVTAGNASGIVDGAAAVVVASAKAAEARGLEPIGRIVAWGTAGVNPDIMGIGPAPATRIALEKAGMTLDDLALYEVNEAFAAQCLAVAKELKLDMERLNVNGGAIAIGHPLGATGARLTLTMLYELRRRGERYGLVTMCIGGGQGIAAIVESF